MPLYCELGPWGVGCGEAAGRGDQVVSASLSDLRDELGLTLFLMTHDLAIADHMSDSIGILSRGRIVESGSP